MHARWHQVIARTLRGRYDIRCAADGESALVAVLASCPDVILADLALLRRLDEFSALNVPLLAGLSRKSMLGAITGRDAEHRDYASVAAALLAVQRGARIVRVHDVGATVDALKVWNAVNVL